MVYTQVWFIKVLETRKIRVKVWYVKFEFDEEDEGHLEAAVVVHNKLYVSEGEEDGIHSGLIYKSCRDQEN